MLTQTWVNIDSCNGLLPDGTKPLPKSKLTAQSQGSVALIYEQFCSEYILYSGFENHTFEISATSPRAQ